MIVASVPPPQPSVVRLADLLGSLTLHSGRAVVFG
ncbi:MAG: hypothetical protein AW07_01078 [Candidatus Accumulibacter sp. SK-11]|nr:MAG: hypothetical protein AW07_01078 [Candidatus Accumulibacter sp. SK-11]